MTRRTVIQAAAAGAATSLLTSSAALAGGERPGLAIAFAGQEIGVTLLDTPPARDLASMLPLDLVIEDFSTNEKIVRLPRKLIEDGSAPFASEAPGDLCYFAPWGNLALFYAGYRWSDGLIRLGRMENWREPLRIRGTFPVRLTRPAP